MDRFIDIFLMMNVITFVLWISPPDQNEFCLKDYMPHVNYTKNPKFSAHSPHVTYVHPNYTNVNPFRNDTLVENFVRTEYRLWVCALVALSYQTVSAPLMFLLTAGKEQNTVNLSLTILMLLGLGLVWLSSNVLTEYSYVFLNVGPSADGRSSAPRSCYWLIITNVLFIANGVGYMTTTLFVITRNILRKRSITVLRFPIFDHRSTLIIMYILIYYTLGNTLLTYIFQQIDPKFDGHEFECAPISPDISLKKDPAIHHHHRRSPRELLELPESTTTITSLFNNLTDSVLTNITDIVTNSTSSPSTTASSTSTTTLSSNLKSHEHQHNLLHHIDGSGETCLTYWEQQTVIFSILMVCLTGYLLHTLRYNI